MTLEKDLDALSSRSFFTFHMRYHNFSEATLQIPHDELPQSAARRQ